MSRVQSPQPPDPNQAVQNYSGLSRMAGPGDDDTQPPSAPGQQQPPDPQQALANVTNTVRECEERIMSVAGQNPAVAREVRAVRTAMRQLMAAIVSSPGAPGMGEPAPPRTGY